MFKKLLAAGIVILALFAGCTSKEKEAASSVAPDFTLQDLSGKKVSLSGLKGSVVLLEFWATWCPPCRAEIPAIERLHAQYVGKGLTVLAIALDSGGWDGVKAFVAEYKISYTVLQGSEDVSAKYMVRIIPSTFLIDKQGNIHNQYLGGGGSEAVEQEIKALL